MASKEVLRDLENSQHGSQMEMYKETYIEKEIESSSSNLAISHADPWWKTIISGYSTGMIYVVTGHPFDSLKLRLQTNTTNNLFRHLYRGILPPLITTPPSWSINFIIYQASLKIYATDTLSNVYFAGAISGCIWATCMSPPELIKCYAQRYHLTSPQAMKEIYYKLGGSMRNYIYRGLFRGYTAALIRDMPATGAYFWSMECVRRYIPRYEESKIILPFFAGCAAGISCWIFAMPGDCIKSRIQTEFALSNNANELPSGSFIVNAKQILNESNGNLFRFYRGFHWVILRAVVTSGVGVIGLENVSRFFKNK